MPVPARLPATLRHLLVAPALLVGLTTGLARAQETSAARAAFARELIATVAHGDSAAISAALAPRFPTDAGARVSAAAHTLVRLAAQARGLEVVQLDSAGANNTLVTVRAAGRPRHAVVNLAWNRADPRQLRVVELLKAWDPAADKVVWTPARSERELVQTLDRNIGALVRLGAYSGTVLVARGDRVVFARGYGWANLDDSVRNAVDTRYHTASMGKMFTAVAIGQLIEAGKLRLDDTLAAVLPDYPNAERARQITIRQLLAHTAGLGDLWSHPGYRKGGPYRTNRELAWAVSSGPTLFPPGSRWSYSNEGYTVLGAIVERLSGESFEDYMRAHVWGPAGMTGVTIAGGDVTVPHRAIGYAPADDDVLGVEPLRPTMATLGRASGAQGAGGEYATVTDYLRFVQALRQDRLLGRAMRDTLWVGRSQIPWDAHAKYASGFERTEVAGHDYMGHGGGGGYGIDNMLYFSAGGTEPWTIVVLGNYNPPGATDLAAAIARFVTESERVGAASTQAAVKEAAKEAVKEAANVRGHGDPAAASLDTAAIAASARPEIDAANAAWVPGLRQHDAAAIVAAYADSGLFVGPDGAVTRGRAAVERMYAAGFPRLREIRDGAVVQDGLAVVGPTRIYEWGHAWVEVAPAAAGGAPVRSGGAYLTVWQREADGHWRIVRNVAL